jgi:hypothetical protein
MSGYREEARHANALRCHRHEAAVAEASCGACLQPLCRPCTVELGASSYCTSCATAMRTRQRRGRVLALVALVLVAVGVLAYLRLRPPPEPEYARKVLALRQRLLADRCDSTAANELGELLLLELHEARDAVGTARQFLLTCGESGRLRAVLGRARKQVKADPKVAGEVKNLVFAAEASENDDRESDAIAIYRKLMILDPNAVALDVVELLEDANQPCEARALLLELLLEDRPEKYDDATNEALARLTNACAR